MRLPIFVKRKLVLQIANGIMALRMLKFISNVLSRACLLTLAKLISLLVHITRTFD